MSRRASYRKGKLPDFDAINVATAPHMENILHQLFPNGRRKGHEFVIGSLAGEEGSSLKVHLAGSKAGVWADFATGDKGGDVISLVAASRGIRQGEAARLIADMLGI